MGSASTIRTCSVILMIVAIIGALIGGVYLGKVTGNNALIFVTWVVGIFGSIMMNALFHGFADIIDNTYISACKARGISDEEIEERK